MSTKGVLHSVLVGTTLTREKTTSGLGVGTPVERLRGLQRMSCFTGTAWSPIRTSTRSSNRARTVSSRVQICGERFSF